MPQKSAIRKATQYTPFVDRLSRLFAKREGLSRAPAGPTGKGKVVSMSILVSSLLWFTFTMRETHTEILEMPTEVVNVPQNQSLSQLPPENVRVQVVGDGWSILRLRLRPPTVAINAAQSEINIRDAIPDLPKNVEVQSVSPANLSLWRERRITRRVPVVARVEIDTPPTHDLVEPVRIRPDSIDITGATSVISRISSWPTERQRFDDVRDSLRVSIPLSDTLSGLVQKSVESVGLEAVSAQFTEGSREIDVTIQGQPSTQTLVSLNPNTIRVRYRVLFSQYQQAQEAMDFFATVSYDEIRQDTTGRVRPNLVLPENIVLRDVEMIPQTLGYYERID
ncbi:MAG: hypothetical protein WED81_03400 [Rhodothermales bacterium]